MGCHDKAVIHFSRSGINSFVVGYPPWTKPQHSHPPISQGLLIMNARGLSYDLHLDKSSFDLENPPTPKVWSERFAFNLWINVL